MRKFICLSTILLLAGCPDETGQQCPANSVAIGQYALNFAGQHTSGECAASSPDGGDAGPTPLTKDDGGTQFGALCYASNDGGQVIYLVVPNKGVRDSNLLDGGFKFVGSTEPVPGTACGCNIAINETFIGTLTTNPPGQPFQQDDGGLPPISGLNGLLVDTLTAPAGTTGCLCTVPCPVTYTITGTRQ